MMSLAMQAVTAYKNSRLAEKVSTLHAAKSLAARATSQVGISLLLRVTPIAQLVLWVWIAFKNFASFGHRQSKNSR